MPICNHVISSDKHCLSVLSTEREQSTPLALVTLLSRGLPGELRPASLFAAATLLFLQQCRANVAPSDTACKTSSCVTHHARQTMMSNACSELSCQAVICLCFAPCNFALLPRLSSRTAGQARCNRADQSSRACDGSGALST